MWPAAFSSRPSLPQARSRAYIASRPDLPFTSPAEDGGVVTGGAVVVFSAFSFLVSFFSSFLVSFFSSLPPPAFASHAATQSFFLAPFFSSFVMSRHWVSQFLVLVSCAETGTVNAKAEPRNATEHKPTIKRLFIAASLDGASEVARPWHPTAPRSELFSRQFRTRTVGNTRQGNSRFTRVSEKAATVRYPGQGSICITKSCPYLVAIGFTRRNGVRARRGIPSGITKSARFWGDSRCASPAPPCAPEDL